MVSGVVAMIFANSVDAPGADLAFTLEIVERVPVASLHVVARLFAFIERSLHGFTLPPPLRQRIDPFSFLCGELRDFIPKTFHFLLPLLRGMLSYLVNPE